MGEFLDKIVNRVDFRHDLDEIRIVSDPSSESTIYELIIVYIRDVFKCLDRGAAVGILSSTALGAFFEDNSMQYIREGIALGAGADLVYYLAKVKEELNGPMS